MKYQKKPIFVNASPWFKLGDHPKVRSAPKVELQNYFKSIPQNWETFGVIDTLEGIHVVSPGDFIIEGVKGEFYACKPEIFEMTYQKPILVEIRDLARELSFRKKMGSKIYNSVYSLPSYENVLYQFGLKGIRFVLKLMV